MIDIIIPAYNAHNTIDRCIASILMQTETDVKITIVNDGGKDYSDVIKRYIPVLDIREIGYEVNGGPGTARQYGYDHTDSEYVTFIDADDTLYTTFALKALRMGIEEDEECAVCVGNFIEECDGEIFTHEQDLIWMFGKLYKRRFIDKYQISFCHGSRWNEDNGWNTTVRLCANEHEKINFVSDIVYCWHEQTNSITRVEDFRYTYDKAFVGLVENMLWAVNHACNMIGYNEEIERWAIASLISQYEYLVEAFANDRRFLRQSWSWIQYYYDCIAPTMKPKMTYELIAEIYSDVMKNAYDRGTLIGVVPFIDLDTFFYKLENHEEIEYDENDISDYFPSDSIWLNMIQ